MGGKTGTTTSKVTIPPEILARYNSVNARAEQVAQTPFQNYSTDPNAFVAPLTSTQQAGIQNTNSAAGIAQPYFDAATQAYGQGLGASLPFTLAGGQAVDPSNLDGSAINKYLSPYLGTVLGTTMAAQGQQNAQQRSAMQGDAIQAGAFGGDRAGVGQANLAYQQNLSNNQTIANILNQGYGQALSTAQQQQGVGLSAEQANRAALQGTGQSLYNQFTGYGQGLAGLGTGAQQAALQGAGAQLAAGQTEQQTQQAGLSALYNQFLQEKSYPFQTAQFLANIAMGTGALSGSTTSTTQPMPFFSDERLKEGIEPIGETYDGQKIVKFNYKGQNQKQIGLVAQDVERHHPDAVGQSHGFKTVDYDAATEDAAKRAPRYQGGLAPVVHLDEYRAERAGGGLIADKDINAMLDRHQKMYAELPWAVGGTYGSAPNAPPRGGSQGIVPAANLHVAPLVTAKTPSGGQQQSGLGQLMSAAKGIEDIQKVAGMGEKAYDWITRDRKPGEEDPSTYPLPPIPPGRAYGGSVDEDEDSPEGIYKPSAGLNIPQKTAQQKLQTAQAPGAPPQGGLGSALSGAASLIGAGKAIGTGLEYFLPLLGLKDGGVASGRHGYAEDGAVTDTGSFDTAPEMEPGLAPPRRRTVDPALARDYGIRTVLAESGAEPPEGQAAVAHVIRNRVNSGRWGDNAHDVVLAPKQFSPWNLTDGNDPRRFKPDSPEYQRVAKLWDDVHSGTIEDPTRGALHFANIGASTAAWPRQALARGPDTYTTIGGHTFFRGLDEGAPSRAVAVAQELPPAGLAPRAAPVAPTDANISTTNTAPGVSEATWQGSPENVASMRALLGKRLEEERNPGWFTRNKEWLVPILAGAGAMASSNSRYLGSALLQGLGAGATAAGAMDYKTQAQNANVAEQFNRTTNEGEQTPRIQAEAQRSGVFALPGAIPLPMQASPNGIKPYAFGSKPAAQAAPAVASPEAPKAPEAPTLPTPAAASAQTSPVQAEVTPAGYQYNVQAGPNVRLREQVAALGYPADNPMAIAGYAATVGKPQADMDTKIAQGTLESAPGANMGRSNLNTQTQALLSLSPDSWAGQGPGFDTRIAVAKAYNFLVTRAPETAARLGMAPLSDDQMKNAVAGELLAKMRAFASQAATSQQGFRAAQTVDALAAAMPNPNMTPQAAAHLMMTMYLENQQSADYQKFAANYLRENQTYLGMPEAFTTAMTPVYNKEKHAIETVMTPAVVMRDGQPVIGADGKPVKQSAVGMLLANPTPEMAVNFDKKFGAGLSRYFLGG